MMKTITILTLLLACGTAQAADPGTYYRIDGAGGASCGDAVHTLSSRETDEQSRVDAFQILQWVRGYLAAYNARGAFDDPSHVRHTSGVEPPDEATVYLFIDSYCHKHPTAHVVHATEALLRDLGGKIYIPQPYQ
jgi:hypothetical protein